ncbi:CvpA family protein [Halioxenophilus sp. WMMB6]|uniref:CvpA family protein n=1 Tax=Halioxenophilus sp. WMMB6 TaxID=3073815 RepID=UPI00295EA567|nr:CvpA family protein [Halioxenophilus sp. WMMB6]
MNWADISILAILLLSGLISLWRGFIKEALSLAVWLLAIVISLTFREPMASLLVDFITTPSLRVAVAFAILFVMTLLIGGVVNHLLAHLVAITGLTGTDRFLGFLFGLARGVLVVLALVLLVPHVLPINQDTWWRESVLIPQFLKLESAANVVVKEVQSLFGIWFGHG